MNMFIKQQRVTQYNTKKFSYSNLLNVSNRGKVHRQSKIRPLKNYSLVFRKVNLIFILLMLAHY